jgi:hypothetical protein
MPDCTTSFQTLVPGGITARAPANFITFKARYFIGTNIFNSRALAEQSVGTLLKNAATDNLPSVTPARLAEANAALAKSSAPKPRSPTPKARRRLRRNSPPPPRHPIRRLHCLALVV